MNWIYISVLCLAAILYKLLNSFQGYRTLKIFYEKYTNISSQSHKKTETSISEYSVIVQKLLLRAGIVLKTFPVDLDELFIEPKANPFDYLNSGLDIVYGMVTTEVSQGIGIYRQRMFEAVNPLYWINTLLFLPQNIIRYCGGKPTSVVSKMLNMFWWVIAVLISVFSSDIREFIKNYLVIQ